MSICPFCNARLSEADPCAPACAGRAVAPSSLPRLMAEPTSDRRRRSNIRWHRFRIRGPQEQTVASEPPSAPIEQTLASVPEPLAEERDGGVRAGDGAPGAYGGVGARGGTRRSHGGVRAGAVGGRANRGVGQCGAESAGYDGAAAGRPTGDSPLARTMDPDEMKEQSSLKATAADVFVEDEDLMESSTSDTEDDLAGTIDSGSSALASGSSGGMDLWADEAIDATLPSSESVSGELGGGGAGGCEVAGRDGPAADECFVPAFGRRSSHGDGLKRDPPDHQKRARSPGQTPNPRVAQTADSKKFSPAMAERMMNLWSGRFGSSATPRMSIKTDVRSIEAEAHLNIQPRVMCDTKDAGLVQGVGLRTLGSIGRGRDGDGPRSASSFDGSHRGRQDAQADGGGSAGRRGRSSCRRRW